MSLKSTSKRRWGLYHWRAWLFSWAHPGILHPVRIRKGHSTTEPGTGAGSATTPATPAPESNLTCNQSCNDNEQKLVVGTSNAAPATLVQSAPALIEDKDRTLPSAESYGDSQADDQFYEVPEKAPFHFLSLYPELRYEVYKWLIRSTKDMRRTRNSSGRLRAPRIIDGDTNPPILKLMLTCHQVHDEIMSVFSGLAKIYIKKPGDLGLQGPDLRSRYAVCMYTPLWRFHPLLRQAKVVTGKWTNPWGATMPSIPFELIQSNPLKWRKVEMTSSVRIEKSTSTEAFEDRFRETLVYMRIVYSEIDDFIRFGARDGLHVSVTLAFEDQNSGRHTCKLSVSGGYVTVIRRWKEHLLSEEMLISIFNDVFEVP